MTTLKVRGVCSIETSIFKYHITRRQNPQFRALQLLCNIYHSFSVQRLFSPCCSPLSSHMTLIQVKFLQDFIAHCGFFLVLFGSWNVAVPPFAEVTWSPFRSRAIQWSSSVIVRLTANYTYIFAILKTRKNVTFWMWRSRCDVRQAYASTAASAQM